jgi:hypothetical protein
MKLVMKRISTMDRKRMLLSKRRGLVFHPGNAITLYGGRLVPIVRHFTGATGFLPNCLQQSSSVTVTTEIALKKGKAFFIVSVSKL